MLNIKLSAIFLLISMAIISNKVMAIEITESAEPNKAPISIETKTSDHIKNKNEPDKSNSNTSIQKSNNNEEQEDIPRNVQFITYVSDDSGVWTTRGPGRQYKLTGTVKIGEKLSVLSEKNGYYEVLTEKGKTVWIPKKETQKQESNLSKVKKLEEENEKLKFKLDNIDSETAKELKLTSEELHKLKSEHTDLKTKYEKQSEQVSVLTESNERLEEASGNKERTNQITWFCYGAVIGLLGVLIGVILVYIPKPRRNRDNDYYY